MRITRIPYNYGGKTYYENQKTIIVSPVDPEKILAYRKTDSGKIYKTKQWKNKINDITKESRWQANF